MKRILILGNHAGGLYRFRRELIEKLAAEEFEVHFCVPRHEAVEWLKSKNTVYHEVKINRRGVSPAEDFRLFMDYIKLMRRIKPEAVLTYTIKPNIYGSIAASVLKIPYINNITGLGSAFQSESSLLPKMIKILYRIAFKKSVKIFVQNSSIRDWFAANSIAEADKTELIPGSGVNTEQFAPQDKSEIDGKIHFLFIGRIMREKGIEIYIEAAQKIKAVYGNLQFDVVGEIEEEQYEIKLKNLTRQGIVNYIGYSRDVRAQIRNADCIVLPTYYPEGMSNVLLEGAAMGKPLIAADISGCREIVEDGKNGYLCKPKDAESLAASLEKFIKLTEEEKCLMGKISREIAESRFDRNIVVGKYMECIYGILKNKKN